MGLAGHCAIGLAAKPLAPNVPLVVLLVATEIFDILATLLVYAGIEGGAVRGHPWSHGLLMALVWSLLAALLIAGTFRSRRAGVVVGLAVFSHWILDFISHPIPFATFCWRSWQWSYGHPMPPDLPLLFAGSPRVGLGLYNSISAVQATMLELGMLLVAAIIYARFVAKSKQSGTKPA